jgi:acyl-[acyl-carrier-protein] desaturase
LRHRCLSPPARLAHTILFGVPCCKESELPIDTYLDRKGLEAELYRLYRGFFDNAEKKRRWSLRYDIPWDQCNPALDPAIADVVESFCAVEMYLPDYVANAMAMFRSSRACGWFYANWGYEESKHSLALSDWLLRSGQRTEEQMADLANRVFEHGWKIPHDNPVAMLSYAMAQELATGLSYRNLRRQLLDREDPALSKLLQFVRVDEQAHHDFFLRTVRLFLRHDREGTLRQIRRVLHNFAMPAIHEMADSSERVASIKSMQIFTDEIYYLEVYLPILTALGLTRPDLRRCA